MMYAMDREYRLPVVVFKPDTVLRAGVHLIGPLNPKNQNPDCLDEPRLNGHWLTSHSSSSNNGTMHHWIIVICLFFAGFHTPVGLQAAQAERDAQAAEEAIARRHAERFLDVLRRRPSFGTALQRVSDFHLERGTLDELIRDLSTNTDRDVDLLIAGMLQVHRGQGEETISLLQKVEQQRSADPVASQALARAFQDAGDTASAIAAFERAVQRGPAKADLRTIYQSLARLHDRAGLPDRALDAWKQLEHTFPQDRLIQEDVAARLQESGQLQPALERWSRLAATATNPEQRTQYQLNAADIHIRLNQNEQALRLLNGQLQQIRSGSWLDTVIRKRIERVLLTVGGRSAIVAWYRERLDSHPDDGGSITRLANLLSDAGQFDEAESLYLNAIQQQPSSVDLRVAFVRLLAGRNQIERACTAGLELAGLPGVGTDEFELVGRLLLRHPGLSRADRETQASEMWQRICEDRTDVTSLGYTARLHDRSGLVTQAIELFKEVIELDPDNSAWREELGRCLFEQGDAGGAMLTWNQIAAGPRRSVRSLVILSEILESAEQHTAALDAMRQACELDPTISDRIRFAQLLQQNGQQDAGYGQLDLAYRQAESVADRRVVLEAKVRAWQQDPGLLRRISMLEAADDELSADELIELAWMYHTGQQFAKAVLQCERAIAIDQASVLAWESAAAICLAAGLLDRSSEANRRLAELHPQSRIQALQQVVRLEQQLGREVAAIDAAGLLVNETPGHVSSCRQFAELCFETGRDADGIACLRQCLRLNPEDHNLAVDVAQILAGQFQTTDAEAILWQCFDRTEEIPARLQLVDGLIELAQQSGSVARLIQRLQVSSRLDPIDRITFVATVHTRQDELNAARYQLEQGVLQYGRDERLLRKLVEVAEVQQDYAAAGEFQQQLADLSGRAEEQVKLADLRFRSGEISEFELAWIRDARSGGDTAAALRSIDRFLDGGRIEAAELMSQRLAKERTTDWRVLYRLAMIQWRLNRKDDSVATLQKISELELPSDHAFSDVAGANQRDASRVVNAQVRRVHQIVDSLHWLQLYTGNELWSERLTAPSDYGAARCAAVGFRWLAADVETRKSQLAAYQKNEHPELDELTDWCGIVVASRWEAPENSVSADSLLAVLDQSEDLTAKLLTVGLITNGGAFRRPASRMKRGADDAHQMLSAAEAVAAEQPEWLSDIGGWSAVYRVLKDHGQTEQVDSVLERLVASSQPESQMSAAQLAISHRNLSTVGQIVTELLPRAAADPEIDSALQHLSIQVLRTAEQAVEMSDWESLRQATDLAMRLHAARYIPAEKANLNDAPQYRLNRISELGARGADSTPQPSERMMSASGRRTASPFVMGQNGRVRFRGHPDSEIVIEFNEHLDQKLFSLLFLLGVQRDPDISEERLMTHLKQVASDRSSASWITASITIGFYSIAMGDADAGMRYLVPVIECLPDEVGLRMVGVRYLAARDAHKTALALLNQLPPPSGRDEILEQEQLALRLCMETGEHDRARVAASRLFELSLQPVESVALLRLAQNNFVRSCCSIVIEATWQRHRELPVSLCCNHL
jgi:tetratricopeptide (TPR) repeat protein